jgi:hypothetical protein
LKWGRIWKQKIKSDWAKEAVQIKIMGAFVLGFDGNDGKKVGFFYSLFG